MSWKIEAAVPHYLDMSGESKRFEVLLRDQLAADTPDNRENIIITGARNSVI